jgi:predicted amidohydrolase YtcJ
VEAIQRALADADRRAPAGLWVRARDLLLRPFASVLAAGARQAFSSDYPCGALAPLAGIHAAVTRRSRAGVLADPHEAITPAQALLAYTLGAAQAAGMAAEVGSLEAGKRGDFVVLSANPLECPAETLASLEVLETWVGGERLHPAASGTKGANRPLA